MGCCAHIYHNNNRVVEKADRRTHIIFSEKEEKVGKKEADDGRGPWLLFHPLLLL